MNPSPTSLSQWLIFNFSFLFHSRLVELERQCLKTRKLEEKELRMNKGRDADYYVKNPSESQGGVIETYIKVSKRHCQSPTSDGFFGYP